jgi:hypothetical protein
VWTGGCPYTHINEILRHISRNVTRNCLIFIIMSLWKPLQPIVCCVDGNK